MAGKIKGIYKGFKSISQIFVVKEREMEIGQPTDVIHVAHIGGDHSSTIAPSWMNGFKIGPNKTTKSSNNTMVSHPTALSTRSSQDINQSMGSEATIKRMRNRSCTDLPNVTEKRKRRKSTSITESSSTKSLHDLPNVTEKRKRRRKSTSVAESSSTKSRRLSKTKTTSIHE
ncbi:hypothetical protein HRI_000944600 [Hibiscus trionum]|uniref:CRIB domain-containing protein n=1 Tax=Hibiscus trionum TaxID=183268 RepID=A0A9W7LQ60_HIBTR|nr:hypothetical protein HRI_000944600 [Hibiscus trionum]